MAKITNFLGGTFRSTHSVHENHHRVRGFFRSSSFALCAPLAPPMQLEGRGRCRCTLVEADARTARTATPIGCGRRVTIDLNGDWLEVTRCQRAPENKLERGAGIYLGQSHGFFRWAVISESWGYKLTRSARLF